ncbi:MAG: polysaccharide deacetylase family protein [Candidatus Doudnabacteria bacterium]|jgi:peptidoglycan/xylan/chitin deacetylase (PgdA/CDA1 family)
MNYHKKIFGPIIFILIILSVAVAHQFFYNQKILKEIESQKTGDIAYQHLITTKDVAPLPETPGQRVKLPILMYHHIGALPEKATSLRKDLTVSTEDFETQVKWLAKNGYHTISLKDLYNYSLGKFILPEKPIIFTFDDGYQDVFVNAIPILKKYGFVGSFAIITQYPGTQNGDNIYASWDDITSAYLTGNEIVSHTQDHFDGSNPKYSSEFIHKNLCASKTDIKDRLGLDTNILIYPYGHYTAQYIKEAKSCGFDLGITVHEGNKINPKNLMEIPRVRVHGNETLEKFIQLLY